LTSDDFIKEDASLGKLGLFRVYDHDIIVGIGTPAPGLDASAIDREVHYYLSLIKSESYHSIIDVRKIWGSSKDQREWIHGDLSRQVIKSYAIVAPGIVTYLLTKLAIRLKSLSMPNKLFRNFDDALQWTIELKSQSNSIAKTEPTRVAKSA